MMWYSESRSWQGLVTPGPGDPQGSYEEDMGSHIPEGTVQYLVPGKVFKYLFYFNHREV